MSESTLTSVDLDAIEARALAATPDVFGDDSRIYAPTDSNDRRDGEVICEHKHSLHPNAQNDAALFAHARGDILALVAALRDRDATIARLTAAVRAAMEGGR